MTDMVDGLDHCLVNCVIHHVLHETAIELEIVDREVFEIAEGAQSYNFV